MKKQFRVAITGHRPNKLGNDYDLSSKLLDQILPNKISEIIYSHTSYKPDWDLDTEIIFISGMALGVDQMFAKLAVRLGYKYVAAIPCKDQDIKWPEKSKHRYHQMLSYRHCTAYYVSNLPYDNYCMQRRNQWMVDNCDLLIAVYDGSPGGTKNCINYALSVGKKIEYVHLPVK